MKSNVDSSNCILVQDVKAVTHDQMTQDLMSTQSPTEGMYLYIYFITSIFFIYILR